MGINVKHGQEAAPIAVAAYGGGQAKRQVRDTAVAVKLSEARKDRIAEANARNAAAIERANDRKAGIAEANLDFERKKELIGIRSQSNRDDYESNYTEKQRRDVARMNDAVDTARRSGDYTDDEIAEIEREVDLDKMNISPSSSLRKPKSKLGNSGYGPSDVWEQNGATFTMLPSGEVRMLTDGASADNSKADGAAFDAAAKLFKDDDGVIDYEKVNTHMEARRKALGAADTSSVDEHREASNLVSAQQESANRLTPEQSRSLPSALQIEAGATAREARLAQTERKDQTAVSETAKLAATIRLMPEDKLKKYVKDAAKRKDVSEESVWAMINREMGE